MSVNSVLSNWSVCFIDDHFSTERVLALTALLVNGASNHAQIHRIIKQRKPKFNW